MTERHTVRAIPDDPAYWTALANRIHDTVRRRAAAGSASFSRRSSDAETWLAARSRAVSLLAFGAAVAAAIMVAQLRVPTRVGLDAQSMWASALSSGAASGSLKGLGLSGPAGPSIAALMMDRDATSNAGGPIR